MIKISADLIFTGNSEEGISGKVVICDAEGTILAVEDASHHDPQSVKHFRGIITPGFVNTHCHLELSHMKGLVDTGTGLLPFLQSVVKFRDFPQEVILDAIAKGDQEMWESGVVAVGDISNKTDTAQTKEESNIAYYTFVEMFDFMQPKLTPSTIEGYSTVYANQSNHEHNKKSYVPHAPYTVSKELYAFIKDHNESGATVSIHNQETAHEDQLFKEKAGGFLEFYEGFGFDLSGFEATGQSSIFTAIKHLRSDQKTLFVHNTMTSGEDIDAAHQWSQQVYWATCPNANLYIENRLPDYQQFIDKKSKMTIGTDSLTSNWQLSIFEEIKTIRKFKSYVSFGKLIEWACKNGAEALSYDHLGTIEVGKKPGLVHIDVEFDSNQHFDIMNANCKRIEL